MKALVRNVIESFVLALINMHVSTEGTSYDLVHQLLLGTATSLKGTATSFSLHTRSEKRMCDTFGAGLRRFLPVPAYP